MIDFLDVGIENDQIRENFEKLRVYLNARPLLSGDVKLLEIKAKTSNVNFEVFHNLGFKPTDILITYISDGTVSPNYKETTKEKISFNVSEACTFRVLVGSFDI